MSSKAVFTLILSLMLCITAIICVNVATPEEKMVIPPGRQAEAAALVERVLPTMGFHSPEERAWDLALKLYGVPINSVKYDDIKPVVDENKTGVSSTVER